MKKHAETSLSEGSFIFNNYLMYKYYDELNHVDSVKYYKGKILNDVTNLEAFVYESLLTEVDPDNKIQYCTGDHTHK